LGKKLSEESRRTDMKKVVILFFSYAIFILFCLPVHGDEFPKRPIRMIVPFAAGGGTDVLARAFQGPFERALNGKVIVENMSGGSTKIAVMELIKAKPDGYTLMLV
jgi:tripartite-type tricarboxylate transporter receptor subunit TctC